MMSLYCGYAQLSSTCTQIVTSLLRPPLSPPIPSNTRYPIPWVLIRTYLLSYSPPTMIIRMSLTSLTLLELCIIVNREYSLQNTRSKSMVCPKWTSPLHRIEGLLQMATRSHVRIVARNSSRTSRYKQIQNYRVMQSYIHRWIETYRDAYLSLVFQMGGVSEIEIVELSSPPGLISIPSDMNSSGSVKSALWFGNRIRLWLSPSPKKPLVDWKPPQFKSLITISIGNSTLNRIYVAITYSEDRFEINDRKGLEIIVLTSLLTFQDSNDAQRNPDQTPSLSPSSPLNKSPPPSRVVRTLSDMPPPPPPKPAPRTGVDGIAEMQAMKGEYNEIIISDVGDVHDYAKYCNNLLQVCVADWFIATSFITLLSGRCYVVHHFEVWWGRPSA